MSNRLNVGDRVRVMDQRRLLRYLSGDRGTVRAVPEGRRWYYLVAMDRNASRGHPVAFTRNEIEPDE